MATTLNPGVRAALAQASVNGNTLRLGGQLDRDTFVAFGQLVNGWGGRYRTGKDKRYEFPADVDLADAVALAVSTGTRTSPQQRDSYFATPDALADQIVRECTDVNALHDGAHVLEPSAGDGSLVRAIRRAHPRAVIHAIEPNPGRADRIPLDGMTGVETMTFEQYLQNDPPAKYDAVVMNPPFTLPGRPTAWIDHVHAAYDLLVPGGQLVAITPAGLGYRSARAHTALRALVADRGGWRDLPEGSFIASGTDAHTCVLWLTR